MQPAVLEQRPAPASRFYYGWVVVVLAAVAMTATLPGRTHGLGFIAKPITEDPTLGISEGRFGVLNFWAVLLGAALCFPVGRMLDRFGARVVMTSVTAALGLFVVAMSWATDEVYLFITLMLVRGLGQGSLSVVSMAAVGKWFTRRLGVAMGVYTALLAIGFIASTVGLGEAVKALGWRPAWAGLGWVLVATAVPFGLLMRSTPESIGLPADPAPVPAETAAPLDLPLGVALRSPAFWAITLSVALFNLTWSAITMFNESILAERGFDNDTYILVMAVLVFSGLPSNLVAGWLAGRWPLGRVLVIGMIVFAASLAVFPSVCTTAGVVTYAFTLGVSGGVVTVIFFAAYGKTFGRGHLGAIQATVQVVSVFASAVGPLLLTQSKAHGGSYTLFFYAAAPVAPVLGLLAWLAPLPRRSPESAAG